MAQAAAYSSSYDVLTMKFCYIDSDASFTYYRDKMLQLETGYPAKRFVWWTMPIETTSNAARQGFNDQVRAYARANGKVALRHRRRRGVQRRRRRRESTSTAARSCGRSGRATGDT